MRGACGVHGGRRANEIAISEQLRRDARNPVGLIIFDAGAGYSAAGGNGARLYSTDYRTDTSDGISMASIQEGDIVRLKSGGPKMTVTRVIGGARGDIDKFFKQMQGYRDGDVVCSWFEGGEAREKIFSAKALEKLEDLAGE